MSSFGWDGVYCFAGGFEGDGDYSGIAGLVGAISAGWAVNYFWVADYFGDNLFSARFGDTGVVEEVEEGRSHFCLKLDFEYRKVRSHPSPYRSPIYKTVSHRSLMINVSSYV